MARQQLPVDCIDSVSEGTMGCCRSCTCRLPSLGAAGRLQGAGGGCCRDTERLDPNDEDNMGSLSVEATPPLLAEEGLLLVADPWWNTLWATCAPGADCPYCLATGHSLPSKLECALPLPVPCSSKCSDETKEGCGSV